MERPETVTTTGPQPDPVRFEHALARATEDLRRIATSLADRHLKAGSVHAWNWPVLLEIEEQAFRISHSRAGMKRQSSMPFRESGLLRCQASI
ncbi:DUF2471 family protein [Burkholderia metallica]|uniref:hypothetical protein n=1 Tax=Burkholderia metallica TaxID=488729 RepID=UPI00384AE9E6